jgi:hypothetical protein
LLATAVVSQVGKGANTLLHIPAVLADACRTPGAMKNKPDMLIASMKLNKVKRVLNCLILCGF